MFSFITKFKREFVYSSFLFLIFELLVTPGFVVSWQLYLLTSILGLVLLVSWIVMVHTMHTGRKVSKWSEVLLKVSFGDRMFANVLMPIIFYVSVSLFLFVDVSKYLNQLIISLSTILIFITMLHIRASYEKVFSIEKLTRSVNDFINIFVYFLLITAVLRFGFSNIILFSISFLYALYSFIYMLIVRRRLEYTTLLASILYSALLSFVFIFFSNSYFFVAPIFATILVYLFVSIMHIRFSGATKFSDYIPPLMYSLMALILVLSL